MQATEVSAFNRTEHNRLIATLPRKRTKQSSKLQVAIANAIRWARARGEYDANWNQAAWTAGFRAGVNHAMRWPTEAAATAAALGDPNPKA